MGVGQDIARYNCAMLYLKVSVDFEHCTGGFQKWLIMKRFELNPWFNAQVTV